MVHMNSAYLTARVGDAVREFKTQHGEKSGRLIETFRTLTLFCKLFDDIGGFNLSKNAADDISSVKKRVIRHTFTIDRLLQGKNASFDEHPLNEWDMRKPILSLDGHCTSAPNQQINWFNVNFVQALLEQLLNIVEFIKAIHDESIKLSEAPLEDLFHRIYTGRSLEYETAERQRLIQELTSYREYYVMELNGKMMVFLMRYLSEASEAEDIRNLLGLLRPESSTAIGRTVHELNVNEKTHAFELVNLQNTKLTPAIIRVTPHPQTSFEKLQQEYNKLKGGIPLRIPARPCRQLPSDVTDFTTAMERWQDPKLTTPLAIRNCVRMTFGGYAVSRNTAGNQEITANNKEEVWDTCTETGTVIESDPDSDGGSGAEMDSDTDRVSVNRVRA